MDLPEESVLEAIFEDGGAPGGDGTLAEDVDMLDAEILHDSYHHHPQETSSGSGKLATSGGEGDVSIAGRGEPERGGSAGGQAKRRKGNNRKGRRGPSDLGIADINRMVDIIQSCGGQKTADGRRFRMGGGILWNILKTREPKAYKEIMSKGREFEKQFKQHKTRQVGKRNEAALSPTGACETVGPARQEFKDVCPAKEVALPPERSNCNAERESVLNRIRVPVVYNDLFEEGEIV